MANSRSAKKRIRSNARKATYNKRLRSRSRTAVKTAREAIETAGADEARKATMQAISELDRVAQKGVIHRKNAARRKSRLMKSIAAKAEPSK